MAVMENVFVSPLYLKVKDKSTKSFIEATHMYQTNSNRLIFM